MDLGSTYSVDLGGEFGAAAVEQDDPASGGRPHDVDQVMGLRACEFGGGARDGGFGEVSVGHRGRRRDRVMRVKFPGWGTE